MARPVLSKKDFVDRYFKNEFGNHSPTWNTEQEFLDSGYKGLVHLRNRIKGGPTWYDVPAEDVSETLYAIESTGYPDCDLYFSAMCPTEKTTFQGEVQYTSRGLYVYGSYVPKPMRQSLLEGGKHYWGIGTVGRLRHHMNQKSYEWLEHLLEEYPNHVIEFTCLSECWGTDPNHNTLWWECRSY